jgi:cellulose synthase/poly-beta-1,6-N-acetylglucosamine synthase-like glycosyltransferase
MQREIFVESPLAHPSVVYRRAAILGLGGYRDQGWPEDYDLWLRAARAGLRFDKVPEVLLSWRDEPDRTSRRNPAYSAEAILRCKAHHLATGPLRTDRPVVIWGAGPVGSRLARALRSEGVSVAAFVDIDPRKIGRRRGGASIVGPDELDGLGRPFVVAAVGVAGARDVIREQLLARSFVEGTDFVCAA